MSLLPDLIFEKLWVPVSLMIELETRNLLEVFLGDDSYEVTEALVRLCHEFDTRIQESEAFGTDLLVDEVEATDGEMPSRLHACGTVVFSKRISAPSTLFWRVLSLADQTFWVDLIRFKDAIGRHFGHEFDEVSCVIVVLINEDSQFGWN